MTYNDQILVELVRMNTFERSIDYLVSHYKIRGMSDKETSREILKLLLKKLEDNADE